MELYLVRHAIAFNRDASEWPDDSRRPLTPEGEARFRKAARGLRRLVPAVDVALSSPYPRAWRTAELLHEETGWPAPEACSALEAERSPIEGIEAVRPHAASSSVALVGHEPTLSEIASILLAGTASRLSIDMKKGAVARLTLDQGLQRGTATLRWLLTPKALRGLG
jgi:phosphohistidine phosphatase